MTTFKKIGNLSIGIDSFCPFSKTNEKCGNSDCALLIETSDAGRTILTCAFNQIAFMLEDIKNK